MEVKFDKIYYWIIYKLYSIIIINPMKVQAIWVAFFTL